MELPIYELMINESVDDDAEVNFVALVDRPAIQKNWNAFKEKIQFEIVNEDKRIISGPLMLADTPIFRSDNIHGNYYVIFSKDTIFKIAQKFFKKGYQANVNIDHDPSKKVDGVVMFESFISDKDRGIAPMKGFEDAPDGSWFGSFKVENDSTWEKVKNGEVKGFSVEGIFEYSKSKTTQKEEELMQAIYRILEQVDFGGEGSGCHGDNCGRPSGDSVESINISSSIVSKLESGQQPSVSEIMKLDKINPDAASLLEDLSYSMQTSYKNLNNEQKTVFDKISTKKDYELYRVDTRYNINTVKPGENLDFEKAPTFVADNVEYVKTHSKTMGISDPSIIVFPKGTKSIRHKPDAGHEVIRGTYKVDKIEGNKIFLKK